MEQPAFVTYPRQPGIETSRPQGSLGALATGTVTQGTGPAAIRNGRSVMKTGSGLRIGFWAGFGLVSLLLVLL
ncbi:hypothetical protein RZS08_46665, partial [Arthrospira platensis SPKY1]|nr:hypothetical protein [Arthrospira platensis SPKY1]